MVNPIIKLELMRRFRSPMAAWGIPLAVVLPGLAVIAVYASTVSTRSTMFGPNGEEIILGADSSRLQEMGQGMFAWTLGLLVFTILIIVPAIVGGSIAGERHSQTLQPVQLTAMTPGQIIHGKLAASVAYLMVIILAASPVLAVPFLLGGVRIAVLAGAVVTMLLVIIELAAVSLAVSATFKAPLVANIGSLLACGFLMFAPFVATGLVAATFGTSDPNFQIQDSFIRYLSSISPLTLGSWVLPLVDGGVGDFVKTGDKIGSLLCFVSITMLCLSWARLRVTAPVERDR